MMRKLMVLTTAAMLVMGSSSLAFAEPQNRMGMNQNSAQMGNMNGQKGHKMMKMRHANKGGYHNGMGMFSGLNLSQDQQQKMTELMNQHRNTMKARSVNPMMNGDMYNLITAEKFDEAQVRKQIEESTKQQVERRVEMVKLHNQMYQLLTPEQKAQLKSRHENRMNFLATKMNNKPNNVSTQK